MKRFYFKTQEKVITEKQGYVEFEENYTQLYDNVLSLTLQLKSLLDIQILLFLSKNSNKYNVFNINALLFEQIKKSLNKDFTERTFYNSIKNLIDAKLVVKMTKGQYQINPIAIWRESQKERDEIIGAIIEGKEYPNYKITSESSYVEEPIYMLN